MNTEDIGLAIVEIRREAGRQDHESAHGLEDKLHQAVLAEIADGHETPASLARAALQTLGLDFQRWCA